MVLKPTEVVPSTVQLLNVPDVGVPRTGVTKVGLVAKTNAPVPVSSVTAAAKFADDGVPRNVAIPVPNDVIPVPPLATGRIAVPALITAPSWYTDSSAGYVTKTSLVPAAKSTKDPPLLDDSTVSRDSVVPEDV